ncbi:hypothetical protein ACH4TQ_27575 [Streptomyces sp. NPDC021218]|uniref:hypothetical protein n=1 Tax=Streptomyces sp. NPDC021218 TaxID=3365119 RepID=UPI0037A82293
MDEPKGVGIHRDAQGRFIYTAESARRDAAAADLRAQRYSYQRIADELGYNNRGDAWRGVQRAMQTIVREPVERLIQTEAAQLDELYAAGLEVLERAHLAVSNGKVVIHDGQPVLDDGPRLAAIRELRQIRESYRKLHGLDAPSRVSVEAETLGREISRLLDAALGTDDDDDDADA